MKQYLGLTLAQAQDLALAEGREAFYHEETDDEFAWLEVSTAMGNGCALVLEDGKVTEYQYLDWC